MGVAEGDFNGDGLPDLFVDELRGQVHAAYRGQPRRVNPSFADVRSRFSASVRTAIRGWGRLWVDLDLDTDLDLVSRTATCP